MEVVNDLLDCRAADIHKGHRLDKQDRNVTDSAFSKKGLKAFQIYGDIMAGSDFINRQEATIVPSGLVLDTWISQPNYKLQTVTSSGVEVLHLTGNASRKRRSISGAKQQ
jgi:hypothetical protein